MGKVVQGKVFMVEIVLVCGGSSSSVVVVALSKEPNRVIWDILRELMRQISMAIRGSSKVIGNKCLVFVL
jgi:hypothetical protein